MTSQVPREPMDLLTDLDAVIATVRDGAAERRRIWPAVGRAFEPSALNLAAYLELRRHDLRGLQRELMALGLSSLGRMESRVVPGLEAVRASLAAIAGSPASERPSVTAFFDGETRLAERADAMLGKRSSVRPVGLLVTCPSEAAQTPSFMLELAKRGVEAVRINCAHDDAKTWARMIDYARTAKHATMGGLRIFMDLSGPKIRTGRLSASAQSVRLASGDQLCIALPGALEQADAEIPAAECTLAAPVQAAQPGQRMFYDDGKLAAVVERTAPWGLVARVERSSSKGVKLKKEKGLNFPDTEFNVDALTEKDEEDLDFVAHNADGIEYSFVQSPEDVRMLQGALAKRRADWQKIWLVLKIETSLAVNRLPEILVQAAAHQPTAIMIARGDLAVEIGFERLAEMQEEILWLAEAAHVPVIWATQVLEHLVAKGTPSRGEMTDAAMAARAECVMLNKGPYVLEAIDALDLLLARMAEHTHKKTPQLRPLRSWDRPELNLTR